MAQRQPAFDPLVRGLPLPSSRIERRRVCDVRDRVMSECETCGADNPVECSCQQCGEHACDCQDDEFEDWADEQIRLWNEYNQQRIAK
jgi:hypothetical protein